MNQIDIYQSPDGETRIEVRLQDETIWLNQRQMAELFDKDTDTISLHLKNIYSSEELEENSTTEYYSVVRQEGTRQVTRRIKFYNLDAIISVGYRVNSKRGTQFRQWATQRLKDYLIQGYAINEQRLAQKQQEVEYLRTGLRIVSRALESKAEQEDFQWLLHFSKGLELLDDYDHESLDDRGLTLKSADYPDMAAYRRLIAEMKAEFSSDIFGLEKDQGFQSAIGQIAKGIGEQDLYPSIEEKAAMLLYFVVKNHAFVDGNKRIAAACFLLFLNQNELLYHPSGTPIISHEALASMTLFVAASKPEEMETVKRLVMSVLNRNQEAFDLQPT